MAACRRSAYPLAASSSSCHKVRVHCWIYLNVIKCPCKRLEGDIVLRYFARRLEPEDWARFAPYAQRVRTLLYNGRVADRDSYGRPRIIGAEAFDEIARTRTTLNILPNLRTLEWYAATPGRVHHSILFMHENVKSFKVLLSAREEPNYTSLCKDIVARMPSLTHLDLRFSFSVNKIKPELIALFSGLSKLQIAILPLYCITGDIMEALSRLPNIGTIQFEFLDEQGSGDMTDVMQFSPKLEAGAFPSLWDLSLSARLSDMTRFLNMNYAPTNLTSLYVHVISVATPSVFTGFLNAVADNCHLLTSLYIDLAMRENPMAPPVSQERLTFENLRPLLNCPNLTTFELRWDLPLNITPEEIEIIAVKWPSLEVFLLNYEPMPFSIPSATNHANHANGAISGSAASLPTPTPTPAFLPSEPLTLRALLPFARHCPRLRELGMYVNATAADISPADPMETPPSFKSLQKLQVGLSRITESAPVALFLSQICPLGCEVNAGVSWPEGLGVFLGPDSLLTREEEQTIVKDVQGWWKGWNEVQEALPLLTRLRMEERARRKMLEKEVEDLRIRCKLLEERSTMGLQGASVDGTCVAL